MDYHGPKNLVNRFLLRYAGWDKRPVFFDIDQIQPALRVLEREFPAIQAEADALLAERVAMPNYHAVNPPSTEISSTTPGNWKVFMLELLGHKPEANRKRCPKTCAALAQVPGVLQAFFSVLEPGKSIPLHDGPYVGYLRYHLGLRVPKENPPKIVVAGQPYTWQEGKATVFDDSWPHEVINTAKEPRVVLIVDFPRPLPWLPRKLNDFVLWKVTAPTYGKKVADLANSYNGDLF